MKVASLELTVIPTICIAVMSLINNTPLVLHYSLMLRVSDSNREVAGLTTSHFIAK